MSEKITKNWGYELVIQNSPKYCGKILFFEKGKKGSRHYHKIKEETWYINGKFLITLNNESFLAKNGDIIHIPPNTIHQVEALEDASIFEVSTQHFDEDTYRL
jgi:quercetin dioxygenase-like cupin family protein